MVEVFLILNSTKRSGTKPVKLNKLKPKVGQLKASKSPEKMAKAIFFNVIFFSNLLIIRLRTYFFQPKTSFIKGK